MRHQYRQFLLHLPLLLIGSAQAQGVASTFAKPGDSQLVIVAAVLGLVAAVLGTVVVVSRLQLARLNRRLRDAEHELSQRTQTEQVLKQAHEQLESRVRERTADLEMSYRKLNDARDSLAAVNEKLETVARVDDLTGIANRTQFDDSLDTEIKRSLRSRKPVSLIILQLDLFNDYRRQYGRDRADEVVRKTADTLEKTCKRAPDLVARYDDACFGIVMPETEVPDAMRFGERMRQEVFQMCVPFPEAQENDRITASIGVATMQPDKLYSRDDFVSAARTALRDAHESGGNCVEYGALRNESDMQPA